MMRCLGALLLAASALSIMVAPAAHAQEAPEEPTLEANLEGAGFGEVVVVRGANWPPNSIAQIEICGNLGLNGTSDCDQITVTQVGVSTAGTFGAAMLVGNPPVPCPCVFRAMSLSTGLVETLEFELRGAAVNPDEPTAVVLPERRLDITDARIVGSGPWTALFGAPPDRQLVFTVVNTGFVPVTDPSIVLGLGKGEDPTGFVEPPEIGRLEPGESVTLTVDLDMPVFAVGTYAVEGSIPGFAVPVEFRAETSHIPWLLLLIPLLILALVAFVAIRNRVRNRIHDDSEVYVPPPTAPATAAGHSAADLAAAELSDEDPVDVGATWGESAAVAGAAVAGAAGVAAVAASGDADSEVETDDLEKIINEELATAFEEGAVLSADAAGENDFREKVEALASTATGRVAERADLGAEERDQLHAELTEALIGAFGPAADAAT